MNGRERANGKERTNTVRDKSDGTDRTIELEGKRTEKR